MCAVNTLDVKFFTDTQYPIPKYRYQLNFTK